MPRPVTRDPLGVVLGGPGVTTACSPGCAEGLRQQSPAGRPSPVVAVQSSPWLSRMTGDMSGCTRGPWSLTSFSSSSSSMQTSPSTASPALGTDCGYRLAPPGPRWPLLLESVLSRLLFLVFHQKSYFKTCFQTHRYTGPCRTGCAGRDHGSRATSHLFTLLPGLHKPYLFQKVHS